MPKQANNAPEPNRLEQAQQELSALQAEREGIPAALRQAAQDADTQEIYHLRQRRVEVEQMIPAQQVTVLQLQEQEYKRRAAEADAEVVELSQLSYDADEKARALQSEANRLMGELSQAQGVAREYRQYQAAAAGQRAQLLRQMQGGEVDRALRAPLQNPMYGN